MTNSGAAVGSGVSAPIRLRTEGPVTAASVFVASEPAMTEPEAPEPAVVNGHDAGVTRAALPAPRGGWPGAGQDWRPFLRAMVAEIDAVAGTLGRDALLRGVGLQLARMYALPERDSLPGLALDMTEILDGFGWGSVTIGFSPAEHCLVLTHTGLPRVGGAGDPPGTWLAEVLVGLYEGWMAQQPGADGAFVARRMASAAPDEIVIRYGKG